MSQWFKSYASILFELCPLGNTDNTKFVNMSRIAMDIGIFAWTNHIILRKLYNFTIPSNVSHTSK